MQFWIRTTLYVIALSVGALLSYDAFVIGVAGKEASISWQMISLSHQFPLIPFLGGVLCGHFWWRMEDPTKGGK